MAPSPSSTYVTVKGGATYLTALSQAQADSASQLAANSETSPNDPDIYYVAGGTNTSTIEENNAIIVSSDSASTTILKGLFSGDVLIGDNSNDMFEANGFVSIFGGDGNDTVTDHYNNPQYSTIWLGGGDNSVNIKGDAFVTAGGGNDTMTFVGTGFVTVGGGSDVIAFLNPDGEIVGGDLTETGAGGNDTIFTNQGHYAVSVAGDAVLDGIAYGATITGGGVLNTDADGIDVGSGLHNRHETIVANSGNVSVVANTGVQMNTGAGNDTLVGQGYDTFAGGPGDATMHDGAIGNSVFEFNGNGGATVINHFRQGTDHIELQGLTASAAFALAVWDQHSHTTTIIDNATTISVYGVHLTSADFANG